MTKQLTQEMADKYLKRPFVCPYCESEEISAGSFDGEKETREVECENCGGAWHDCYSLTGIANNNFTEEFALRKPQLYVTLEDGAGNDPQESRLYVMLYTDHPGDANACLMESVFTTDEMTEENFLEIVSFAVSQAELWGAKLTLEVTKEDYFPMEEEDGKDTES